MASGKEIRISITSALNAAGIEATKQQVKAMAESVNHSMASAAAGNKAHWADIKAAWDMGCSAIRTAWKAVSAGLKSAFHFETQTTQFKTLIGSIDEARAHMADLKALGDTPPFGIDEFAKASRQLLVMSDGVLGYKKSLEMVGDAAAATGIPLEQMGHAVGRLYAFIRDGQPLSRAVMELRNMGVITPEVAQKLQDMQAAGKTTSEIWAEVETQLGRYNGAMAATEETGEGLIGAIQSRWDNIVRAFGFAWQDAAKDGLGVVLDKMKEIESDGTLEVWANKIANAVQEAKDALVAFRDELNKVGDEAPTDKFDKSQGASGNLLTFLGNAMAGVGSLGAGIRGLFTGEGFGDSQLAYMALHGYGAEADRAARMLSKSKNEAGEWTGDIDIRDEAEKEELEIREAAIEKEEEKRREEQAKTVKREQAEREKMQNALAESQKKIDARNAEAKAKKEQELAAKNAALEKTYREANRAAAEQKGAEYGDRDKSKLSMLDYERDKIIRELAYARDEREGIQHQTVDVAEQKAGSDIAPPGGQSGGSGADIGGDSKGRTSTAYQKLQQQKAYISALQMQSGMYWMTKHDEGVKIAEDYIKNNPHAGNGAFGNDSRTSPYWYSMKYAHDETNKKYLRLIRDAEKRRKELYAEVAENPVSDPSMSNGNAAERTAAACEGILSHFQNRRAS